MENTKRTVTCGELRKSDVGKKVVLNGWVSRTRDLGGLLFIRLRDRYGITQVMVGDSASDDVKKGAGTDLESGSENLDAATEWTVRRKKYCFDSAGKSV